MTECKPPSQATSPIDWGSLALNTDTLEKHEEARLSDVSARRSAAQREKRDRYFLKGPLPFGWVRANIPDPASRLILIAKAFMDMNGAPECVLSAKVWDCAGIAGKDSRRRVLRKIRNSTETFAVCNRTGRPSILREMPVPQKNQEPTINRSARLIPDLE